MDDDILPIIVDRDRLVDGDDLEQRTGRCGAYVSGEDLRRSVSFPRSGPSQQQ
jgi:hypothetical protein